MTLSKKRLRLRLDPSKCLSKRINWIILESLTGFQKLFLFRVPMHGILAMLEGKIRETPFFEGAYGKITVWNVFKQLTILKIVGPNWNKSTYNTLNTALERLLQLLIHHILLKNYWFLFLFSSKILWILFQKLLILTWTCESN